METRALPTPGTLPDWLTKSGLLLGSTMAALLLGEVVVRIVAPQQLIILRPDIWMPVDSVGWTFRPLVHSTINTGERTVHVVTDSQGFRVSAGGRPSARTRVLLIGDSFMAALQVEYEQSVAGLLEKGLQARLGEPVAVFDAGQAGWDPPQYLIQARSLLHRASFGLVIVAIYVGNDIVTARPDRIAPRQAEEHYALRFPRRLSWSELTRAVLRPINDWLKTRSELFVLLKNHLQTLGMRLGLTAEYFPIVFRKSEATSLRWSVTADICRDIAALAAQRGIPTLFVLIPTPFQADPAVFQDFLRGFQIDSTEVDLDQPTRFMDTQLRQRRLSVVDVLPGFRIARDRGARLYGNVDHHLSPDGHRVLDELLEPVAERMLRRNTAR